MECTDDKETMARFDDVMSSLSVSFIPFLDELHKFEKENPNYFLMFAFGKFTVHYQNARETYEIKESLFSAMATVANDPHTQAFISNFVGTTIHNGVTGYE